MASTDKGLPKEFSPAACALALEILVTANISVGMCSIQNLRALSSDVHNAIFDKTKYNWFALAQQYETLRVAANNAIRDARFVIGMCSKWESLFEDLDRQAYASVFCLDGSMNIPTYVKDNEATDD
jgi:hypothetical protein